MIRAGERMEFWYGHWFDCTVVNEDLDHAFEEVQSGAVYHSQGFENKNLDSSPGLLGQ